MFIMQILIGEESRYDHAKHTSDIVEAGEWMTLHHPGILGYEIGPIRYDNKQDAESMVGRLFSHLPDRHRRVVREI